MVFPSRRKLKYKKFEESGEQKLLIFRHKRQELVEEEFFDDRLVGVLLEKDPDVLDGELGRDALRFVVLEQLAQQVVQLGESGVLRETLQRSWGHSLSQSPARCFGRVRE